MLCLVCWKCTKALYARNIYIFRKVSERYLRNSGCGVKMTNAYSLVGLDLGKRPQPTETEVNLKVRSTKWMELNQSGVKWYVFVQILTFAMV